MTNVNYIKYVKKAGRFVINHSHLITNCIQKINTSKLNNVSILYIPYNDNKNLKNEQKYLKNFLKNTKNKVFVLSQDNFFNVKNMINLGADNFQLKMFSNFDIKPQNHNNVSIFTRIFLDDYKIINLKFINISSIINLNQLKELMSETFLVFYYIIYNSETTKTYGEYINTYNILFKYHDVAICINSRFQNTSEMYIQYNLFIKDIYKDISDVPTITPYLLRLCY